MSLAVLRNRWAGRWLPGFAAITVLAWGGCVLDFPIEWLEGECGDGYVGSGEQCDDGDTNSGDGCSATCTEEIGFDCVGVPSVCTSTCGDNEWASDEQCDDGNTLSGDGCDEFCQTEIVGCGDGEILSADGEECDDSNTTAFDGCSDQCQIEAGWNCNGAPSVCVEICGDGLVVGDEAVQGSGCDDENQVDGDGCDFQCQVEPGYVCEGQPSVCNDICGDGEVVAGLEECDDGNITPNDGCGANCTVEDGFTCDGASPTLCAAICGDGTVVGDEAQAGGCDDGNTTSGDGCAPDCTEESGYDCSGQPSTCVTVCGDNIVMGTELCDDGNTADCDGCRGDCSAVETGCGDGFICGSETCDDGNTASFDGCNAGCTSEVGWTCVGEPSVCTVPCTRPEALYLQTGCNVGEMCTVTSNSGGSYVCIAEGPRPYYEIGCSGYENCAAGSTCANVGQGPQCVPYCDVNAPSPNCPMNGSDYAICAYYYPELQTISGICAPNQCDAVAQTGCSTGWCDHITEGVAFCETTDPAGTAGLHGACVQGSTTVSEICQPGFLCINTGSDECLQLCRHGQSDCTVGGEFCMNWSANDPVYGVCQ